MRFHGHGPVLPQFRLGAPRGDPRSHSRSAGASHTADLLPLSYTSSWRPTVWPTGHAYFICPIVRTVFYYTSALQRTFIHKSLPLLGDSSRLSRLHRPGSCASLSVCPLFGPRSSREPAYITRTYALGPCHPTSSNGDSVTLLFVSAVHFTETYNHPEKQRNNLNCLVFLATPSYPDRALMWLHPWNF
jgi:hypothetical protein